MVWNFITHRNNQFSTSLKTELPLGQQSMTSTAAPQSYADQMASAIEGFMYTEGVNTETKILHSACKI